MSDHHSWHNLSSMLPLVLFSMWDRESWEQRATTEQIVGESHDTSADRMRPCGAVTVTVQSYRPYTVPSAEISRKWFLTSQHHTYGERTQRIPMSTFAYRYIQSKSRPCLVLIHHMLKAGILS